jgi:DNA-binding transcriptional LysR family regulator
LHLSSLESYVGYKLFDRTSRKMIPTEKGKVLYIFITDALSKLEEAERNFQRSTEKNTPTISIGMCFETFQITLEPYLATFPFNVIIQFGEYPEMIENLDKGILDLIITPQMIIKNTIDYQAFSSETIVLIGGNETDSDAFEILKKQNNLEAIEIWLKLQRWYGTTGDMEHLRRFWQLNFNKHADFRPNYIVPNLNSIVRCLSNSNGLAVIPDFLCKTELESGKIKLLWQGKTPLKNILYFATKKKTIYTDQIQLIKDTFIKIM